MRELQAESELLQARMTEIRAGLPVGIIDDTAIVQGADVSMDAEHPVSV